MSVRWLSVTKGMDTGCKFSCNVAYNKNFCTFWCCHTMQFVARNVAKAPPGGEGGGRVLLGIHGGVCRPVLQILTLFQTKTCHFPYPFSDLASKMHTRFQTWHICLQRPTPSLRLERQQQIC